MPENLGIFKKKFKSILQEAIQEHRAHHTCMRIRAYCRNTLIKRQHVRKDSQSAFWQACCCQFPAQETTALNNSPSFKSIFEEQALLNAQQKIKNKNKPTHYWKLSKHIFSFSCIKGFIRRSIDPPLGETRNVLVLISGSLFWKKTKTKTKHVA